MDFKILSSTVSVFAVIIAQSGMSAAMAQTETTPEAPHTTETSPTIEESSDTRLETVYVTATKRNESAQDIPIAINVVDGNLLASKGVGSLLQIEDLAPGVQLVRSPTGKSRTGVTIRGLGSSPGTSLFESSVSLFVDGVYAPRSREFTSALFDVERIEVIKGTQAALLGKNTSAGAINVIPRKPSDEFSAELTSSYEFELESTSLVGTTDIPLSDTLKLRVATQLTDQGGWTENIISGEKATAMEDFSIRSVLVYEPTHNIDFTLLAQTSQTDLSGTPAEIVVTSPLANALQAANGYPNTPDGELNRKNANGLNYPGEPATENLKNDRLQLTANFNIGEHTLTSVSGWSAYQTEGTVDADGLAGNYLYQEDNEKSGQFLQEIRLVSPSHEKFDYVIGGMYFDNLLKANIFTDVEYPFGPAPGVNIAGAYLTNFNQKTDAWSIFGQGTYQVSDRFRTIAGMRYTDENKSFTTSRTLIRPGLYSLVVFPPTPEIILERSEDNFDYSGALQYDVADTIMTYLSYGKGTKAGGFTDSASNLANSEFDAETAKTLEAGMKWNGAGWQMNTAAFKTEIDGFQVVTFDGSRFVVSNTDLESTGFEIEGFWQATNNLRVMANTTFAEARNRATGNRIPNAPDNTGSIGIDYNRDINSKLTLNANGSLDWRSDVTYQQDPDAAVRGENFTTLNLSIGIAAPEKNWELSLIGRNLTNENSASFAYPTPFVGSSSATSEMPRTIALQAKFSY
ncbi:TonB-dependent receptor [Hirschia baltica]|uniref:TonB-dependent receptor n=1 Tax=Hirschia baltica (strain ATCC 49814 / DSM 5838 / IFAM 1418) TaxID=582402 RepID=C6XP79_HIRBI|nr:TonB-dependent receptor [Hirschia baltica]ACT60259.1 TonB-dependent receptor [Hirschia baltica ATCC 49814]